KPSERIRFASALSQPSQIAQTAPGCAAGFFRPQTARQVALGFQIEVRLNLFVEFTVRAPPQPAGKSHYASCFAGLRMRDTARTIFSHLVVSAASRIRPA